MRRRRVPPFHPSRLPHRRTPPTATATPRGRVPQNEWPKCGPIRTMTTASVECGRRLGFHVPEPRSSGARTPLPALSVQGSSNGTTNPLGGTLALLFRGSLDLVAEPCRQPNAVGIREKAPFWHRAYFRRVTGSGSLLSVFMVAASGGVRQRRDGSTCVSLTRTAAPDTCRVPRSRALSASSAGVPHSSAPTRSTSGEGWTNGWTIRDATSSLFVGGRGTMARPQSMGGRKVPTRGPRCS